MGLRTPPDGSRRCVAADLSKNGIGVKGVTALAEALGQNDALQALVLDTNSAGDEGAEVLAKHLSRARPSPCCCCAKLLLSGLAAIRVLVHLTRRLATRAPRSSPSTCRVRAPPAAALLCSGPPALAGPPSQQVGYEGGWRSALP